MRDQGGAARFDGKVAFITGGAMGFGKAFGEALASRGAAVALADVNEDVLGKTVAELAGEGASVIGVDCDVADEQRVARAVERTVAELGGVDILINNAGLHLTQYNRPFGEQPLEDLRRLFDVNVMGVVLCTLACAPAMAARGGGVVVSISSMSSHASATPYGVSKLAVRGLTLAFARELSDRRIRVNAISPGLQLTESARADLPEELVRRIVDVEQSIHRTGTPQDIVDAMLFLCSDQASFITGVTLPVTGGAMLGI